MIQSKLTSQHLTNEAIWQPESLANNTTEMSSSQEWSNKMSLTNTRMQTGQKLVFTGFGIAVIGIVLYCITVFSAEAIQAEPAFVIESLGVVGIGVLVWLVGSVKYLNGAIDANVSDENSVF